MNAEQAGKMLAEAVTWLLEVLEHSGWHEDRSAVRGREALAAWNTREVAEPVAYMELDTHGLPIGTCLADEVESLQTEFGGKWEPLYASPVAADAGMVSVPIETARLIRNAFVPRNPNKMRGAAPEVVAAAHAYIAAVEAASTKEPK